MKDEFVVLGLTIKQIIELREFWLKNHTELPKNKIERTVEGFANIYDRSIIFCESKSELEIFCTGEELHEIVPAKITYETENG